MSDKLKEIAAELAKYPCTSFPHLVCDETVGLKFDDWCSPCKGKVILREIKK